MTRYAAAAATLALSILLAGCTHAAPPAADQPTDYPCTVTSLDGAASPPALRPEHPTISDAELRSMRADAPIPCTR